MQDQFDKAGRFELKKQPSSHRTAITVIKFSPGGRLMAIADDGGYLVVRETQNWKKVRKLKASAPIRAFAFHPVDEYALVVGCTNGEIFKMILDPNGIRDHPHFNESVDGFIHTVAIDDAGNHVAVAYANQNGMQAKVFTLDNFYRTWGNGVFLPTPILDQESFSGYPLIRNMEFLPKGKILVSFFPDTLGLRQVYPSRLFKPGLTIINIRKVPFLQERKIQLRPGTLVGSSTVSPSRKIVAVVNMLDGIDIYDIARAQLIKTITYPLGELYMVDICFLDKWRLVCGYSRGELVIASCSTSRAGLTIIKPIGIKGMNTDSLQAIAVATIDGIMWVAAGSTPIHDEYGRVMLFRRDHEEVFRDTADSTLMQISQYVPCVVRYTLAGLVLSLGFAALSSSPRNIGTSIVPTNGLMTTDHHQEAVATSAPHYIVVDPTTKTTTVTKIATIPGPMTTTTELVVDKITETCIVTTTVNAELPTPACTTKTLFEVSTQTVITMVERVVETGTPPVCPQNVHQSLTLGGLFDHIVGIAGVCLMVWSFEDLYPDPSREVNRVKATPDNEEVGAYGRGKPTKGSAEGEKKHDNDIVDDEESVIGATENESTSGQAGVSAANGGDNDGDIADDEDSMIGTAETEPTPGTLNESDFEEVKEYDMGFDTDDFTKGAEAAEQEMGENPPSPTEHGGEHEQGDPVVSEPQEERSETLDPAEDVVSDHDESNIAGAAVGDNVPDDQPGASEENEKVKPHDISEETGATEDSPVRGTEAKEPDPAEDVVSDHGELNTTGAEERDNIPDGQSGAPEGGEQVEPQDTSGETGATEVPPVGGTDAAGPTTPRKKGRSKKKGKRGN